VQRQEQWRRCAKRGTSGGQIADSSGGKGGQQQQQQGFQMVISVGYFSWLFQLVISVGFFRWFFQMVSGGQGSSSSGVFSSEG
jgi:hypothetical protein